MSTDISARDHVENLLRKFRGLVLSIAEEHGELREKLHARKGRDGSTSTATTTTSPPTTTAVAPRTNSETLSSSTATTNSTRPPPYNNFIRGSAPTSTSTQTSTTTQTSSSIQTQRSTTMSAASPTTARAASRGALIVLEGLDRVGKSTLAKRLVEHLERGRGQVCMYRFPNRTTPAGQLINDYLKNCSKKVDDHTMHLLFSANRWEMNKQIRSTLNKGTTIIVDRYSYSGIAYSSAKRDLKIDWCCETEKGLPKPDLVIYLELPKEAQYKRTGFGDERFETQEFQELIRHQYERLMQISLETWVRVDVEDKNPEQVMAEVLLPVRRALERASSKPLGDLDFRRSANI